MTTELCDLPVSTLSTLIAERSVSSEDIVRSCLERIRETDGPVKAWAYLEPELALRQARDRDGQEPRGALHGIPIGVKDVIDTADMPTQRGTPIYAGRRPDVDATGIARLRERGAIILGKTTTTEFATWTPSDTTNPHNTAHTPGGSSSGSAAAVAAGMVPLALGTQTVGSTIRPAAFCGVTGMKPSFGYIPMAGVNLTSQRLDTMGLFGRTPDDVSILLDQLSPTGAVPASETPLRLVRMMETPWWEKADRHSRAALKSASDALASAGLPVEEGEFPAGFEDASELQNLIAHHDIANNLRHEYVLHAAQFSDNLGPRVEEGLAIGHGRYSAALRTAESLKASLGPVFGPGEVVLMPATTGLAPEGIDWTGDPLFVQPWSLFGFPAVTVPVSRDTATGLPIGVQLVARTGDEALVLDAARRLQDALG